jgi:hypothetical protein
MTTSSPPVGSFTLPQAEREQRLLPILVERLEHHRAFCPPYRRILDATGHRPGRDYASVADLPWLPVRMFKNHVLKSISDDEVFKVLTSSGTAGDVSRIYLNKEAAADQSRALSNTLQTVLGARRLPMLVVETRSVITDPRQFSARGAGMLGMMSFGRDHAFVLDESEEPDVGALRAFLAAHGGAPFLVFGFTFMVWQYLYKVARRESLDLSQGILIHSGGWKKLSDQAVDNNEFRRRLAADTGLSRLHNFYGMVEQIGTIFLEGPGGGSLYCPDFADVVIRDPATWQELPVGEEGLIEVVSTLPRSYPGNVLLTEDRGVVYGVDDGDWPGKRFSVLGRLPRAEVRGCSDTFTEGAA